ncbi:MAG: hypothetical protein PVG65_06270, partial [Candidatus Thorarchaeota archaeon]
MIEKMNLCYLWVVISIMGLMTVHVPEIPREVFTDTDIPITIVVGEKAASMDVVAATNLAAALGTLYSEDESDALFSMVKSYTPDFLFSSDEVSGILQEMRTPIVFVPDEEPYQNPFVASFSPLQYYDDSHGFWGTGDNIFQPWETHEEIQLWTSDVRSACEICLHGRDIPLFKGIIWSLSIHDFLSLPGLIYRIDNIFAPPVIMIESAYIEPSHSFFAWDGNPYRKIFVPEPWMVLHERLPQFTLCDTVYTVVDAGPILDINMNTEEIGPLHGKPSLLTGIPHYDLGVILHKDQPREYSRFSMVLKNINPESNTAEMEFYSRGELIESFELVLNPEEGFLPKRDDQFFPSYDAYEDTDRDRKLDPLELSSQYTFYDFDSDGKDDFRKWIVDTLSQDMYYAFLWEYYTSSFDSYILSGYPELIIDGVDVCEGGQAVEVNVYWLEQGLFWYPRSCANPWYKDENFQMYFDAYESGWSHSSPDSLYQPPGTG